MKIKLVSAPATNPVTDALAKEQCRIIGTDEDTLITHYVTAATKHVERMCGKRLVTATYDEWFRSLREPLRLGLTPVQSVTSVKYNDTSGTQQTLASTEYQVALGTEDHEAEIVQEFGKVWPSTRGQLDDVVVRYVVGFGDASAVPEQYKQMILFLVAHWFENRESVTGMAANEVPQAFNQLFWSQRRLVF